METYANSLIINPPKGINPINNDRTITQTEMMMKFVGISKMADAIEEIIADVNMLKEARTISKIMGITRIRIMAIKISTRIIAPEIIRIKEEIKIRILKMVSAINTKMGHANISLADLSMFIEAITTIKTVKEIIKTTKTIFQEIIKTPKTTFRETTKIILRIKNLAHFSHKGIATKDKIATFRMKRQNNRHHNKINKRGFAGILRIRDSAAMVIDVDFLMVEEEVEVET